MPGGNKVYNVADYGAWNDSLTMHTKAIQPAADTSAAGGGTEMEINLSG
jgi:hypothetical protein